MSGVWKALAVWLAACSLVRAGDLPGAGSPTLNGESHAWVALPIGGDDPGAAIVHLPPRRDPSRSDGRGDAEDGSLHLVARVAQVPERLAAWDRELWMVFSAEPAGPGKRQRRVLTMSIERGPLAGAWVPSPQGERLPTVASLSGDGSLAGFVGTSRGPMALIQQRADSTGRLRYQLLILLDGDWQGINLPERWWEAPSAEARSSGEGLRLELVAAAEGPMLVVIGERQGGVWRGRFAREAIKSGAEAAAAVSVEWAWSPLSFMSASGAAVPQAGSPVVASGGQLAFVGRLPSEGGLKLVNLTQSAARVLSPVIPGRDFGLVSLDQVGRVALVWQESEVSPGDSNGQAIRRAAPSLKTRITELSAATGHILFEGPARVGGPVSSQELKLLAIALVGVMIVVVAVILRPNASGAGVSLPKGYALAEPGRRVVAASVDVMLATLVASAVLQVSVVELLSVDLLARGSGGIGAVLLILGIGFVHTTTGDWLIGRSLGKAATGCQVVRPMFTRKEPDGEMLPTLTRPALWRVAVRNLVCWVLPPVAMWGLGAADHRHRGDIASGLLVVIELEEPDSPE